MSRRSQQRDELDVTKPDYGTQRVIGTCARCGGPEYEVFASDYYSRSPKDHWREEHHTTDTDGLVRCIEYLAKRVEALEERK